MAQFDFPTIVPTVDTGTTLSNNLNSLIPALYSTQSGTHRPPYAVANQLWVDTTTPTAHKLYLFDGTQDQLIASYDPATINSLRTGDGLSKADGGTVVKPVTFDSVTNPKKGIMGRTDAPKAGEIGEIISIGSDDITLTPAYNVKFKALSVPIATSGVYNISAIHRLESDNATILATAGFNLTYPAGGIIFRMPTTVTNNKVSCLSQFNQPIGFQTAGTPLDIDMFIEEKARVDFGNILYHKLLNIKLIRVA